MTELKVSLLPSHLVAQHPGPGRATRVGPKNRTAKACAVLALAATVMLVAQYRIAPLQLGPLGSQSGNLGSGGTVEAVVGRGVEARVVVRTGSAARSTEAINGPRRLTTADGIALPIVAARAGDRVQVASSGRLVDTSQRAANLKGIVVTAPDTSGSDMVVSVGRSRTILVDLSRSTQLRDPSHTVSSLAEVEDADVVQIQGILDQTLGGEMTRTDVVSWLGP